MLRPDRSKKWTKLKLLECGFSLATNFFNLPNQSKFLTMMSVNDNSAAFFAKLTKQPCVTGLPVFIFLGYEPVEFLPTLLVTKSKKTSNSLSHIQMTSTTQLSLLSQQPSRSINGVPYNIKHLSSETSQDGPLIV